MFAIAASSSSRNASATVGLRAKYQARAASASSAASGCSRTVWLATRSLNQRANQIGAILFRQRQCLAKNFVSRNRHGQSLLLRRTKRYVPSNGEVERPPRRARQAPRAHTVFQRPRRLSIHASRPAPTIVRSRLAIWAPLPLTRYAVMISVHLYVRAVRKKVLRLGARSHLRAVSAPIAVEWGLTRFGPVGV